MKEKKYAAEKIENFQAEVPMEEYVKECVDVATFLEFCKECSNYGKLWCCPPYTFDVENDYWDENYICQKNLQVSPMWKMNNGK